MIPLLVAYDNRDMLEALFPVSDVVRERAWECAARLILDLRARAASGGDGSVLTLGRLEDQRREFMAGQFLRHALPVTFVRTMGEEFDFEPLNLPHVAEEHEGGTDRSFSVSCRRSEDAWSAINGTLCQ
jgi:hypothetical protein